MESLKSCIVYIDICDLSLFEGIIFALILLEDLDMMPHPPSPLSTQLED